MVGSEVPGGVFEAVAPCFPERNLSGLKRSFRTTAGGFKEAVLTRVAARQGRAGPLGHEGAVDAKDPAGLGRAELVQGERRPRLRRSRE